LASRKEQREKARAEREEREAEEQAKAKRNRRMLQLGGVLAAAVVIVVVAIVVSSGGSEKKGGSSEGAAVGSSEVQQLLQGIPQKGTVLGKPNAPVTVIEFADLKCPFCRDYTLRIQPEIVAGYVRTGKVKMIWRNLAFVGNDPKDTQSAALAATAAGLQNKLWDFTDVFYRNQGDESTTYVTDDFLKKIGAGVPGLDVNRMLADRAKVEVQQQLAEAQSAASTSGVDSTPTFFVQKGKAPPTRVPSFSELKQAIDKALGGA
jgi:protein-disulfide isomerase